MTHKEPAVSMGLHKLYLQLGGLGRRSLGMAALWLAVAGAAGAQSPAGRALPGTLPITSTRAALPTPTIEQIPVGTPEEIEQGRRIYQEGILPSGKPLEGYRLDGQIKLSGATAACMLCHRRSGLGAIEGMNRVAPISGRYLFVQDMRAVIQMNVRTERGFNRRHEPYTLESLGTAIRGGTHVSGRELDPLMPRYVMEERDVRVLASYLRQLSAEWSPGVTENRIRFATVVTPDVDPQRKQAFLATIRAIVNQRNGNIVGPGQRTMSSGAEMILQTARAWDLDVWELQGPPATWADQLRKFYARQPVFALVSGLGATHWEPVQQFCENNGVPCWFPSVLQAPEDAEDGFYSVYFSRGVTLEADVLGRHLGEGKFRPRRVLQVHADPMLAEAVVEPFTQTLKNYKIDSEVLHWGGDDPAALREVLARYGSEDAVVLWLNPAVLRTLGELSPPAAQVYVSGRLAQGESAPLPPAWKQSARLIYPYQLPQARGRSLVYFRQWISERKLTLVDEPMQSEVYFAMTYLVNTLVNMLDNVHRDFLLERAENELSLTEAASAENQAREIATAKAHVVAPEDAHPLREMPRRNPPRPLPGREAMQQGPLRYAIGAREGQPGDTAAVPSVIGTTGPSSRFESTTVYPRLSLAQFQRIASKGAFIVRFANPADSTLIAETDWIVP
ncbi:MAG: hypothetical protein RLY71_164 [Pseudomonadota bacterium]|jgi:hypothetical protein